MSSTPPHARLERGSLLGAVAWSLAIALLDLGMTEALFLLAPLVAIPLALSLVAPAAGDAPDAGRFHLIGRVQLPAALLVLASFATAEGWVAAALAVPWLAVALIIAAAGLTRFLERGEVFAAETAADVGMMFLAVGGAWLVASRAGAPFLGFVEPIVLLTAAHFHFAGLVLPVVVTMAGRVIPGVHATAAALAVVAGMPLVAAGITLGGKGIPYVELAAAWWMTAACVLAAVLGARVAWRLRRLAEALLLALSSIALVLGMAMAATYALGAHLRAPWLDIPTMVKLHATTQIFGFALPALVFWRTARTHRVSTPEAPGFRILWRFLGERATASAFTDIAIAREAEEGPREGDRRDRHEAVVAREVPGEPERDGPFRRASAHLHHFEIFPPALLVPELRKKRIGTGDTVVCRYLRFPAIEVAFAARVSAVFDDHHRSGFTYRTLAGHPLVGEETFAVDKDEGTGEVTVSIRSWSRPRHPLVRLLGPIARRLQLEGGRAGAAHLAALSRRPL